MSDFHKLFRFFLYDCDLYTRNFFIEDLGITQPDPIDVSNLNEKPQTVFTKVILYSIVLP